MACVLTMMGEFDRELSEELSAERRATQPSPTDRAQRYCV